MKTHFVIILTAGSITFSSLNESLEHQNPHAPEWGYIVRSNSDRNIEVQSATSVTSNFSVVS